MKEIYSLDAEETARQSILCKTTALHLQKSLILDSKVQKLSRDTVKLLLKRAELFKRYAACAINKKGEE